MNTVVVIGAGASGIMAALTAAEDKSNRVILLERQQRIGRKLLATGNGRCNLTNIGAELSAYHGEQLSFAQPALDFFTPEHTLDFFKKLGLATVTEPGGRVYPLSNSANSVLDVLRFALEKAKVELCTGCAVRQIERKPNGYLVHNGSEVFPADALIVACGGAAGAKLGGVRDGYEMLQPLGHKSTKLFPALVQLITAADYPRALKGIRADGELRLVRNGEALASARGELQFTENGVSGPAAFDISRAAATVGEGSFVHINFMRAYKLEDIEHMLLFKQAQYPELLSSELFTGLLHNRLGRMLVKYAGINPSLPLNALKREQLHKAALACADFSLPLYGTEGFDHAQVTAGGIKTSGFNPETLESWFMPGLFVCGELLDIDGDCGGYNLQWAWASGRLAGRLGK